MPIAYTPWQAGAFLCVYTDRIWALPGIPKWSFFKIMQNSKSLQFIPGISVPKWTSSFPMLGKFHIPKISTESPRGQDSLKAVHSKVCLHWAEQGR